MTDAQATAIRTLRQHGTMSGRGLRAAMELESNLRVSAPAFYQMMVELEHAGFVVGRYDDVSVRMYHLPHFEKVPT